MTKQEIINLETKAKHIQEVIDNHRKKLSEYENSLLALIEEINKLKNNENMNKNNQKSQGSSNNNNK